MPCQLINKKVNKFRRVKVLIKCLKLVSLSNSIKTIDVKCLSNKDSYEEDEDEKEGEKKQTRNKIFVMCWPNCR